MQPEDPIIVPAESDAELAAVAAASARVDSWGGTTVDDLRHFRSLVPETRTFLALVAGEAAGYGTVGAFPGTEGEPHVTAAFGVVPELRRRGVGSALHRAISEHARRLGKDSLQVEAEEDDGESIAHLERRGYVEVERQKAVVLDLAGATLPDAEPPPGVEIVPRSERPHVLRGMYEVALEANADIPGLDSGFEQTFEQWRAFEVERPSRAPELCFVALHGDEVVGYASIDVMPGGGFHGLTGVRRSWRRRGVGTELKVAQIRAARRAGLPRLATESSEGNLAMRRLNESLGYRPAPGVIVFHGPLV